MNIKLYTIIFLLFIFSGRTFAQTDSYELFVTFNGNLYIPVNNPTKGIYPIIGYDEETDAKLLIGGLGVGLSAFKPLREKITAKGQVNLSKHTYWDEPTTLIDENSNLVGPFLAGSSDFSIGITATAQYALTSKIALGTGIGGQVLLASISRVPDATIYGNQNDESSQLAINRYYKRIMPTVPVELSYKTKKALFNIRYEHGLLNRYKADLKQSKKDHYGLLFFEVGFKIKE